MGAEANAKDSDEATPLLGAIPWAPQLVAKFVAAAADPHAGETKIGRNALVMRALDKKLEAVGPGMLVAEDEVAALFDAPEVKQRPRVRHSTRRRRARIRGLSPVVPSRRCAVVVRRNDRRDLALLALYVFVFGVVGAPLLHLVRVHGGGSVHAVAHRARGPSQHDEAAQRHLARTRASSADHDEAAHHDETVPHHHGPAHAGGHEAGGDGEPPTHRHAPSNVEHLQLAAAEPTALAAVHRFEVALAPAPSRTERRATPPRYRPTSMPGAP